MSTHTIKETKDIILFGMFLCKTLRSDLADGKMSVLEIIGLWKVIGPAQDAFSGIANVPKELGDLDEAEIQEVVALVRDYIDGTVTEGVARDIANRSINAVQELLKTVSLIRDIHPVPEIVP